MLLSLVLHSYSMRYLLPGVVLLGSAPTYVLAWGIWRLLSALLPARIYQMMDDRLYCVYQSMVLFFFENYTGVQVRHFPRSRAALVTRTPAGTRAPPQPQTGPPHTPGDLGSVRPGRQMQPKNTCRTHPPTAGEVLFLHLLDLQGSS
jgi:hypothetical protein